MPTVEAVANDVEPVGSVPTAPGFEADLEYFERGGPENEEFWEYFDSRPVFEHGTIVDVGCGHGRLCIDIASSTPSCTVIGLDINPQLIEFARWILRTRFRELESRVQFLCMDVRELAITGADFVVSKASFEHILELGDVLAAIRSCLKPGGRLYTGFDPLYHSPFGGHGRIHDTLPFPTLPWGHLILPEKLLLKRVNRRRAEPVSSVQELGLNQLTIHDFRQLFARSGMRIVSFRTNLPGLSWRARAMNVFRVVPALEKFMTYSIYAVLERLP